MLGFLDSEPQSIGIAPFLASVAEFKRRLANMSVSLDSESVTEEVRLLLSNIKLIRFILFSLGCIGAV